MRPLLFFGWSRNSKTQQLSPQHALVLQYGYFHLFWLFRITVPRGYSLATLSEYGWATRPLDAQEPAVIGAAEQLQIHWWWRWGLLIAAALIVLLVVMTSLL